MFIEALFIIARSWKEPRCPSAEEWIQNVLYIYTMEYYSAIKNNEFMKFLGKWMDLEDICRIHHNQQERATPRCPSSSRFIQEHFTLQCRNRNPLNNPGA